MKILIADDTAVARVMLAKALDSLGHPCTVAEDGEQAWEQFERDGADVIISDWVMPGISGDELCRRVREASDGSYTYFILLTSLEDKAHVLRGMEAGADDYLTKPFDVDELEARLIAAARVTALHAERSRLELELRLAHKLDAVGQLAAGMAHEINTPIQVLGDGLRFLGEAFGDLMELQSAMDALLAAAEAGAVTPALLDRARHAEDIADLDYLRERVPAALERSRDGVKRVASIVQSMRELAPDTTGERALVDINQAVRNALDVAGREYAGVADVETSLSEVPPLPCHEAEIKQALLALIVNAAHAIADRVGDSGERGSIRVSTRLDGDAALVSVADTGCGIRPAIADRVFDPFFTTKEVGRGSGQGLALARTAVADRHGGSLTFESEEGRGTTFHLRLPLEGAAA